MSSRLPILIAALLVLAGCQSVPVQPQLPKTVYVEVDKLVPLDPTLLDDCPIAAPTNRTVHEAVAVANARKLSLERCNEDKAAIRAAQPKGGKP